MLTKKHMERSSTSLIIRDMYAKTWETYMQVRKKQLELDMEQQTGSK